MPPLTDDDVRWLLDVVADENLDEIEIAQGEERILIRARVAAPVQTAVMGMPAAAPVGGAAPAAREPAQAPAPSGTPVVSPMAGIFYGAPSPDADPFVEVGDKIEAGHVIGLIEAMKMFNEVPSPVAGVVMKAVTANEDRVEAEQVLMYVQPVLPTE